MYRHPVYNADELDEFTNKMRDIFHFLNHNNTDFIILRDFNIDLLQTANSNHFRKYANNLIGCSCKCVINAPTRISKTLKTLLDHIYVPSNTAVEHQIFGGIALCDITNHLPVFAIKSARLKSAAIDRRSVHTRDFSNFEPTLFATYLQQQHELFDYSNKSTVNEKLKQFKLLLQNSINEFAPLKKHLRKEVKLKQKPWLSKSLLKSIKHKNKLFRQVLSNNFQDTRLVKNYKVYRIFLNRTIENAKRNYYNETCIKNQYNQQNLWKTVYEIVHGKKCSSSASTNLRTNKGNLTADPQEIAETFNDFLVNVGVEMAEKIDSVDSVSSYTTPQIGVNNSIFFSPSTTEEVISIINTLKDKKAIRNCDIETSFIKIAKIPIAKFLSKIFNSCLELGIFPDDLKIAEVIPIFKKGDPAEATNYRLISILSQFSKIFETIIIYSYNQLS